MFVSRSKGIVVAQIRHFMAVFGRLRCVRAFSAWKQQEGELQWRSLSGALQLIACVLIFVSSPGAFAGGSGLNTLVVVNQSSSNSCAVGNYYCERRQVPPENLLRINWAGSNI